MTQPFADLLRNIQPVDPSLYTGARARLDDLTKPRGSLGRLEDAAARLYVIAEGKAPLTVDPALLIVAAGDHGVTAEGVSAYPQEVTRQMLLNILAGGAASSVLTRVSGMDMLVVDAGSMGDAVSHPKLVNLRLGQGTGNMAKEPAMSEAECEQALLCGADAVKSAVAKGVRLVATGEMGIGNSTPATALFCAFLGMLPEQVTGPGAGLNAEGVRHKAAVVGKALALHSDAIKSFVEAGAPEGALAVLAALGGYEIAVLAGVVLGAAACRIPVLVDGFISTSAFTAARALCPAAADYAFLAHASAEPGYAAVTGALGQEPLLRLNMRLGEGTGCAAAFPLLRAAAAVFNDMSTFSGANVTGEIRQPV